MADYKQKHKAYYSPGSEARDMSALPQTELPKKEPRKVTPEKKEPHKRLNFRNLLYLVMTVGVTVCLFAICARYLSIRGQTANLKEDLVEYKTTLNELKVENDELEDYINTDIDYNKIYDTAINEYGMVYPDKGQIRTYNADGEGYVRQYADIP